MPLDSSLVYLVVKILNGDMIQDKETVGVKVKKEIYNSSAFTDELMEALEVSLKGIEILKGKLKDFGALAAFKINEQKTKMLTKI